MREAIYERIKKNLEILNMKNTLMILDNYLEKAIHDKTSIVGILDYLLAEEAKTKKNRAVENQIKMSLTAVRHSFYCSADFRYLLHVASSFLYIYVFILHYYVDFVNTFFKIFYIIL